MRKSFCTIIVTMSLMIFCCESNAIDPLTSSIGSAAAQEVAGDAVPLVTKGAGTILKSSFLIVKDALGVLWLPVGAVESTVGAPFGLFGHGVTNMVDGVAAPFKVAGHVIKLPFQLVGAM